MVALIELSEIKIMEKKILFLAHNSKDYFSKKIKNKNINLQQIFWQNNIIYKAMRRIHLYFKLPFISVWVGNWKNYLSEYDIVVIPASSLIPLIIRLINKVKPTLRIIVWFDNPISKNYKIEPYKTLRCELWSFDMENCIKYNMTYNTQYYFDTIKLPENKIIFDVMFVGAEKDRLKKLLDIEQKLKSKDIKTYFHIIASNKDKNPVYKNRVSYETILEYISQSKIILDILQDNQSGLTLRPLEALFFSKKLITNNKDIVKSDFYNENNIFVLGLDEIDKIYDFIKMPYVPISEEVKQKYEFSNWIKRF